MKKVTFRIPVKDDGTFDIAAQQDLAKEYVAIASAVQGAEESLESIMELKPRADLPKDVQDLGPQPGADMDQTRRRSRRASKEDARDAEIALKRLAEIAKNPKRLISGKALKERLADLGE